MPNREEAGRWRTKDNTNGRKKWCLPQYNANDCDIRIHEERFCLEFKMKVGEREEVAARVLMSPVTHKELSEVIEQVLESHEEARVVQEDEDYKGVEFG